MPTMADTEQTAIHADAQQRLAELRTTRSLLLRDADDPVVLSELCLVESQIRCAEAALSGRSDV